MKGLKYYPQENGEQQIEDILSGLEIQSVDLGEGDFKSRWDKLKKKSYGDKMFLPHQAMHSDCIEQIERIKSGKDKLSDFDYNYVKLYDLLCSYMHSTSPAAKRYDDVLDVETLNMFVNQLVFRGVNITELKTMVLSSVLLDIDNFYDGSSGKRYYENAQIEHVKKFVEMLGVLEKFSPYERYFNKIKLNYKDLNKKDIEEYLNNISNEYDKDMIKNILDNRMKNDILEPLFNARFEKGADLFFVMNTPIMKEFYEYRPEDDDDQERIRPFDFRISEKGQENIAAICSGELKQQEIIIEALKDDEIVSKNLYNDFRICNRGKSLMNNSQDYYDTMEK